MKSAGIILWLQERRFVVLITMKWWCRVLKKTSPQRQCLSVPYIKGCYDLWVYFGQKLCINKASSRVLSVKPIDNCLTSLFLLGHYCPIVAQYSTMISTHSPQLQHSGNFTVNFGWNSPCKKDPVLYVGLSTLTAG